MFNFKKLIMPTGGKKEVDAVKTWTVRWTSRYGEYSGHTQEEVEVFTDEDTAKEYAEQLTAAFKFLRYTSGTTVIVKENK
jgi:hypothetical protein